MPARREIIAVCAAIAALVGATIIPGCGPGTDPGQLRQATLLPQAMALPDFQLVDQNGESFSRDSLRDRWSLLFFGFTQCPDICPATLLQLTTARANLVSAMPDSPVPKIILISVDPERDTPDTLHEYVAYFGGDIAGVTGNVEQLRRLTSSLGIYFEKQAPDGDQYNVSHSTAVILINQNAEFHAVFGAPLNIDNIMHDLPILMAAG